jgi:hypothetical protein
MGLLDGPDTTHANVLAPHFQRTQRIIAQRCGLTTLLVGDITELDYTSKHSLQKQLGPIGNGGGHGFECFNLLAIDPDRRTVIGLANQILFRRRRGKRTRAQINKLPLTKRQSGLWVRATQELPPAPPKTRVVRVFDREGDSDEALKAPGDFLIRSRTSRCIRTGPQADAPMGKLHAFLRTLPSQGRREVVIEPSKDRAGRTAVCGISFACVTICWARSPENPTGRVWGVRVWELDPPAGEEPVEWLLLTNVAVENVTDAGERVDWYECRWLVEEYHKALKTGVRIEQVQLTTRKRLEPLIGILSVVALSLLGLRDAARDPVTADQPADAFLDPLLIDLAAAEPTGVKIRGPRMTVREFYQMVARIGGYLGNFQKRPPGWQTLWRGWTHLLTMAQGVTTFQKRRNL